MYTNDPASVATIVRALHKHGAITFGYRYSTVSGKNIDLSVVVNYGLILIGGEAPSEQPLQRLTVTLPGLSARSVMGPGYGFGSGYFFKLWVIDKAYPDEVLEALDRDFVAFVNAISRGFAEYIKEHGDPVARLAKGAALHPAEAGLTLTLPGAE